MKKLILLFCFLLISSLSYSQFLAEDFDYTAGDSLGAHSWTTFSGSATNRLFVTSPGLTYTNYIGSGIGNATTLTNNGQDQYKSLNANQTSGSIYTSMMVNVTTARTGDYFTGYLPSTSTTLFTGRFYVKLAANGNIAFGASKTTAGSGGIVYGDSVFTTGVTYLMVFKYTFNTGTGVDDQVSLFVFGGAVPSTEPAPYVGPLTGTGADLADLGRVFLRQGTAASSPDLRVDGIYTYNSWDNSALPVELSSFSSAVSSNNVTLNWSTVSENNNSGFDVERSSANNSWSKVGNVSGNGTTTNGNSYAFTDRNLAAGNYNYRLKQIDFNGNFEYFNLSNEVIIGIPGEFELSQNYPNPFNPSTKISFALPNDGNVSLKIYDMSGKEAMTLVNEVKTAGYYSVSFNASSLSSGIYFYTLSADNFTATKKMMLVK